MRRIAVAAVAVVLLGAPPADARHEAVDVLFTGDRGGTFGTWRVPLAGGEPSRVGPVKPGLQDQQPAISPDGCTLAFVRAVDFGPAPTASDISLASVDGSDERVLVAERDKQEFRPAFSPDGSKILFSRSNGLQDPASMDLWVVATNGASLTQLTTAPGQDNSGSWSPDGNRIGFTSAGEDKGPIGIWIIAADGSGRRRITNPPTGIDTSPQWSPRGDRIVFRSTRNGAGELWTVRPDGSGLERLTDDSFEDRFPTWTPDGRTIVWSTVRAPGCPPQASALCASAIFAMDADGKNVRQLTAPGPFLDTFPAVVPVAHARGPQLPTTDDTADDTARDPAGLPATGSTSFRLTVAAVGFLALGSVLVALGRSEWAPMPGLAIAKRSPRGARRF